MVFVIGLMVGTFVGFMIAGLCRSIATVEIEPLGYERVRTVADIGDAA
jgi:hypothetical protein